MDRQFDILERFVNNTVKAQINPVLFGQPAGITIRADIESDDDCIGGRGQHNIGLANRADAGMDYFNLNLIKAQFKNRLLQRFHRTLDIAFDDQVKLLDLPLLNLLKQIVQGDPLGPLGGSFNLLGTFFSNLPGQAVIGNYLEPITGQRNII